MDMIVFALGVLIFIMIIFALSVLSSILIKKVKPVQPKISEISPVEMSGMASPEDAVTKEYVDSCAATYDVDLHDTERAQLWTNSTTTVLYIVYPHGRADVFLGGQWRVSTYSSDDVRKLDFLEFISYV